MIGLGQEDEIEEITLQPEIWWHDAVHHEADHCMKRPHSSNVRIFWSSLAKDAVVPWTSCNYLCHLSVKTWNIMCPQNTAAWQSFTHCDTIQWPRFGSTLAPGYRTLWCRVPVARIRKAFRSREQGWKSMKESLIPCKFCTYQFIIYSCTRSGKVHIDPLMENIRNSFFFRLPGGECHLVYFGSTMLTHWDQDEMDAISHTTFSNAFFERKYLNFDSNSTEICSHGSN